MWTMERFDTHVQYMYSNHHSPSHDIAQSFAEYQNVMFVVSGDKWGLMGE